MDRSRWLTFLLSLAVVFVLLPGLVLGQSGKIRGIITDAETGDVLMGANVLIQGTQLGAATDENGEFLILNVPVGRYDIVATYMGYQKVTIENVIITNGLTTYRDVEMPKVVLEGQEVVIVAERPLVDKNATNDIKVIRAENLENFPIRGYANVVQSQAGAIMDANGYIHVRGSRDTEVAYYVDGVLMNNPYDRLQTGDISNTAMEEISYQPGGMSAEYGGFNAGVVNTVTKTGGSELSVAAEASTDEFLGRNDLKYGLDTYSYGYNLYNLSVGGPVPMTDNKLRFYANAEYLYRADRSPRWGPTVVPSVFDKNIDSLIALNPEPIALYGTKPGNRTNNLSGTANLQYSLRKLKLKVGGHYFARDYRNYLHDKAPFDVLNMPKGTEDIYTGYLRATYIPASNAYIELNANYYTRDWEYGDPIIWDDFEDWTNPAVVPNTTQWGILPVSKTELANFNTYGRPQTWFYRENMDRMNLKLDATWQANSIHELKAGADVMMNTVRFYDVGSRVANAVHQREVEAEAAGRQPTTEELILAYRTGYANNAGWDIFGDKIVTSGENAPRRPKTYSVYVNDKMEFRDMVLNVGLRVDHIIIDQKQLADPFNVTLDENGLIAAENFEEGATYTELNPRLGMAFPVTDRTVFHLQYGKYTQAAPFDVTYVTWSDLAGNLSQGNYTNSANPSLKPVKTTSYEVGFEQQLGNNASIDITAFYKEIRDQVYLLNLLGAIPVAYASYVNGDFGNVKGFSFDFNLRRTNRVMATMNYTLQWANGTGSDPNTQYNIAWQNPEERPTYVAPLDYDQRHTVNMNLDFRTLAEDGPELLGGHPLGNFGINILWQYGSGRAYTPETPITVVFGSTGSRFPVGALNSAHMRGFSTVDLRVDKRIDIGRLSLDPYIWVINLLNTEIFQTVYNATGLPNDDGWFTTLEGQKWAESNPVAAEWYQYRVADPENYGWPRQIRLGLKLQFK